MIKTSALNPQRIDTLRTLGEAFMMELFGTLEQQFNNDLEKVSSSISNLSLLKTKAHAHSLKSTALNIGADNLAEIASSIEDSALDDNGPHLQELLKSLELELEEVIEEVKSIISSVS